MTCGTGFSLPRYLIVYAEFIALSPFFSDDAVYTLLYRRTLPDAAADDVRHL